MVKVRFACGHQQDAATSQRPVCRVCGNRQVSHVLSRAPTATVYGKDGQPTGHKKMGA